MLSIASYILVGACLLVSSETAAQAADGSPNVHPASTTYITASPSAPVASSKNAPTIPDAEPAKPESTDTESEAPEEIDPATEATGDKAPPDSTVAEESVEPTSDDPATVASDTEPEAAEPVVDASRESVSAGETPRDAPPPEQEKAEKKKDYDVDVHLRIVAGVRHRNRDPDDSQVAETSDKATEVRLRQVRGKIEASYKKMLSAKASFDLADLLGTIDSGDVLRDAWGNIRIYKALQFKVGQFKRPYSRAELRGVSKLPFVGRGLYNSLAVEDLGWGDRATGAMVHGYVKPKRPGIHRFGWQIDVSNDLVSGAPEGIDAHARVEYDPVKWLSIGGGGAFKSVDDPLEVRRRVYGAGGDVAVDWKHLYVAVEADGAQDWTFADESPWMLGVLGYASYEFRVGKEVGLQPGVAFEYTDANMSFAESEAYRIVGNFNVLWTKYLRILPQVDFVLPVKPVTNFNPFVRSQTYALWLSFQL